MSRFAFKNFPFLEFSALLICLLALVSWLFDTPVIGKDFLMSRAAAISFIPCIASKIFFEYSQTNKKLSVIASVLAIFTLLAGIVIIAALFSAPTAFDDLFYFERINGSEKLSVNTLLFIPAGSFVLLGIALYRIAHNSEKIFLPHIISLTVLSIALLSALAYLFNENTFHSIPFYKPMGLGTAVNFFLLSFSILRVNKHKGFISDITSPFQGGKIARVLIPMAIIVPVILGFFQLQTENGIYKYPYDIALLTIGRIAVLVLFIWRTAVIINRSNKIVVAEIEERKRNEEALRYRKALLEAQNEAIPDAILVVDTKGKILSYNHHFAEMWHIPQSIIDTNDDAAALEFAITQLEKPEDFIERVNYIYAHPEDSARDEITFKDGRIIERYGNAVIGDDGTKYGWAWYFRDITVNRKYENEIKNFNKDLEIKVKERTEELSKSEKRFRTLVENANDIISLSDEKGIRFYMSPSIERISGYTVAEALDQSVFTMLHPDDIHKEQLLDFMKIPGNIKHISFRFIHKNGSTVWMEGTIANLLHDENVKAIVGNYHDVTERKKSEEELHKSEKRFRSLVENAEDIISLSDEKGIRFYMSPAIERITGFSIEETINQPVFNLVHPDDVDKAKKLRAGFMKEPGVLKPMSFRFIKKDGGFVWLEGTLINLLYDENVNAVVGNFHDVTERKRNEENIRITNERFEMVSKATNDAIWDWDLDTDKITWNEEIKSMFDYNAEDIATGTEWKTHIHPQDFNRVTRKILFHIKNGIQKWQDEYRFRSADSTYKYIFNRGFILFNNDNKPYRIIGAMQDVTQINKLQQSLNNERIKKQRELTNATIQGQEKERTEIGRELHDNINQLITGTKLYLDVAATQSSMKDEMIKKSIENLSLCMEEIRKLSSTLVPPSIELNSLEEVIQDLLEPLKLAAGIKIDYKINNVDKNLLTNEQQLNMYRIIQEHLNNILKHSKAKNVFITITHSNNHIDINIKDDGQGFDVTARRKGIGFKNIQSRAELLGGNMNVISKPGKGCSLVVKFPLNVSANSY